MYPTVILCEKCGFAAAVNQPNAMGLEESTVNGLATPTNGAGALVNCASCGHSFLNTQPPTCSLAWYQAL